LTHSAAKLKCVFASRHFFCKLLHAARTPGADVIIAIFCGKNWRFSQKNNVMIKIVVNAIAKFLGENIFL
jgi:hypothetical protein